MNENHSNLFVDDTVDDVVEDEVLLVVELVARTEQINFQFLKMLIYSHSPRLEKHDCHVMILL